MPIDPETKQPYNPLTGKQYVGPKYDPATGQPINPDNGEAIPDRFNTTTSRP